MISIRTRLLLGALLCAAVAIASPFFAAGGSQPVDVIAHGQHINVKQHLVHGKVTILDFYADWCGPCRKIAPWLEQLPKNDSQIVLRKVDIVNWQSPVAKQFNLDGIPHVQVYNGKGQLVGEVSGVDPEAVQQFIAKAKM